MNPNDILALLQRQQTQPTQHPPVAQEETQAPQTSWVQDLINSRYQVNNPRKKRTPIGFTFNRDPFDPSSYYKQIGTLRDLSTAATQAVNVQVANRQAAQLAAQQKSQQDAISRALQGIGPSAGGGEDLSITGVGHHYKLKGVEPIASKAADYFGAKYGIKTIYGLGPGSVPGSDHPHGRAIDLMINNTSNGTARGTQMANDIIKNYKAWKVKYVIWNRYIWHPGIGWKPYHGPSDHTDHVHVSFY